MSDLDFDGFEEYFLHDLEKSFSADIACCGQCYNDFLSTWPLAYSADDSCFQKQEIDLEWFYDTGYLRDEFSKEEFYQYIVQMQCPRCGNPLGSSIWAYNFPFNVPDNFEKNIQDVSTLARTTPFLLLEHEFCRTVLASIRALSNEVASIPFGSPLFRARSTQLAVLPECVATFDFPPATVVQEGRYNHAGAPVLYLASDKKSCQSELRDASCLVLEFDLITPIRILDLTDPYQGTAEHADLLNSLVYSALVSAQQPDDGWHKPHYVFSRFVADCARAAGFDAIKYPSTRRAENNFNLVVVNPSISIADNARPIAYHNMDSRIVQKTISKRCKHE